MGDLVLDPATRRESRENVEIDLTPKEFGLLELFLRHPGEVLSRTRILEHVWDFAYDGDSNVVDVYVARRPPGTWWEEGRPSRSTSPRDGPNPALTLFSPSGCDDRRGSRRSRMEERRGATRWTRSGR